MFKFLKSGAKVALAVTLVFALVFPVAAAAAEYLEIEVSAGRMPADEIGADLDEGLAQAVTAVRELFEIDNNIFTHFNWHYWPGDGFHSPESWILSWNSNDWNAHINAQITSDGMLLHYSRHEWSPESNRRNISLAEITPEQARANADALMSAVFGASAERFEVVEQRLFFPSDRYMIAYVLMHDGFMHPNYMMIIEVDKLSGEILGFHRGGHQFFHDLSQDIFAYEDGSVTISREEALAAYLEHIGIDLIYASHFDWQTRSLTVRPVYRLSNNWDSFISAVDGSLINIDFNIFPAGAAAIMNGGGMAMTDYATAQEEEAVMIYAVGSGSERARREVHFSNIEQDAIDHAADLITAGEAIAAVSAAFGLELVGELHTNLRADHINRRQFVWDIHLSNHDGMIQEWLSASVDARNGNIISFWHNSNEMFIAPDGSFVEPEFRYTYEQAIDIVFSKVRELSPHGLTRSFELVDMPWQIIPLGEKSASYHFHFVRVVNGLQFPENFISVNFDNMSGRITGYNLTWFEDAGFRIPDNIITPEAALNRIADFSDFSISYMSNGMTEDGRINVSLIYRFESFVNIDPFTGNWLGWDFQAIERPEHILPDYQDLEGHWSEEIVNKLADNGIFVWGGEAFEPDRYITRGEFMRFLSFYANNPWLFTELDSSIFISHRGARDAWDLSNSNQVITNQQAARIIAEIAGYGAIASHYAIFVCPFGGESTEYTGYIAILYALGVLSGEDFNGSENMTRAEAAAIIYNIIMSFQ